MEYNRNTNELLILEISEINKKSQEKNAFLVNQSNNDDEIYFPDFYFWIFNLTAISEDESVCER